MTLKQYQSRAARIEKLIPAAADVVDKYLNMQILGAITNCPYHINYDLFSRKRALLGKGSPAEIKVTAEVTLPKLRLTPKRGDGQQLKSYLEAIGLGVDCSGFASWVMNAVTETMLKKPLWNCLVFTGVKRKVVSRFRPVENISANLLTSHAASLKVDDIKTIRPGDLIRAYSGGHVMVVAEVGYDAAGCATYFQFAHSSCSYGKENGARTGFVVITKPSGYLLDQQWLDEYPGVSPAYNLVKAGGEDSRIVRLKALASAG